MDAFVYILKIAVYFLIIFLIYFIAKKSKKDKKGKYDKTSLLLMTICCALFGLYSIWCGQYPYANDRLNFAFRFEDTTGQYDSFVRNESLGLYGLETVLHFVTHDAMVLFFVVAFLFMFVTVIAYRRSKNSSPFSLLFLLLSGYPIFALYSLKQAMAMAFVALGYTFWNDHKNFRGIVCLAIAILFHESAWIVIPVLLILGLSRNRYLRVLLMSIMAVATLFFGQLSAFLVDLATKIVPSLKNQIYFYLDAEGGLAKSGSGMVTAIKGLPFYYLLAIGFKDRKNKTIPEVNYNNYLIMTAFVSSTVILSGFMYWMFRFGLLFYMPVSDFSSILYNNISEKKKRMIFILFIIVIPFLLSVRQMAQYYFLYGGL